MDKDRNYDDIYDYDDDGYDRCYDDGEDFLDNAMNNWISEEYHKKSEKTGNNE